VTYRLAENELRNRVVGTPDGSKPSAKMYSKMPDWTDLAELRINGMVTSPVDAKQVFRLNVGSGDNATVPASCPRAGGVLKVMVAFTVESNAGPLSAEKPSRDPAAEPPSEMVGKNVATKLPGLSIVAVLHAEASPTA